MDDLLMIKIGPSGGHSGTRWDEKGCSEIVQIFISYDEDRICSIQFQYVADGALVLSPQYGERSRSNFDAIKFSYPEEYVTRISGQTGAYSAELSSLSIGTNLATYGPFGKPGPDDRDFRYNLGKDRQFGGFYGSVLGGCVSSLGVYLKPAITLDLTAAWAPRHSQVQ